MRRLRGLVGPLMFVAAIALVANGPWADAGAQDGMPTSAGHPLVGAWAAVFGDDVGGGLFLVTFADEGTVVVTDTDGDRGIGSWAVTGPGSATVTYVFLGANDAGRLDVSVVLRAAVEVDAAGGAFTAETSYTFVAPDGTVGDTGLLMARGVRIAVEGPTATGNPLAGFPTVSGQAAATPVP